MTAQQFHDRDAERAVLGACIWDKNARIAVRRIMSGADFYEPIHERLFVGMSDLDHAGRPVDPVTVWDHLAGGQDHGDLLKAAIADVTTLTTLPGAAEEYARIVHGWAIRRRLADVGRGLTQRAMHPGEAPEQLMARAVTMLQGIRDRAAGDTTALTLSELMSHQDDDPTWVIPGLLESGDRLMLTGTEGAGKSALSRQLMICAAAGRHPFTDAVIPPVKVLIVDAENKATQIRRQTRPLIDWLQRNGAENPLDRVLVEAVYPRRINLLNDRDLGAIHQLMDAWQPQIVFMGPIYRMSPKALQTDDDAHPFLAALDTITERGAALIVEAHAGHATEMNGKTTTRNLRPRGSSALIGWPEFGLGLREVRNGHGVADLEPWRGGREARQWPTRVRRSAGNRWVETNPDDMGHGYDGVVRPPEPTPEPQGSFDAAWDAQVG